jgi:hypothetical protein
MNKSDENFFLKKLAVLKLALIFVPGTQRRAGSPGAFSALSACGVSQDFLFPQESRAWNVNQQSVQNQQ